VVEENASKEDSDEKSVSKGNKKDVDTLFSDLEGEEDKNKILSPEDKKRMDLKKKDLADLQLQSAINVIKGIKIYRKFQQK
jgi:hypothetical protein